MNIDINKFLSDIYGNINYDLKLTKDTINQLIEYLQNINELEYKEVQKISAVLEALISREKAIYDYLNTKKKLLIDVLEKIEKGSLNKQAVEEFFEKYDTIDIYKKEVGEIDIKEFMKERTPEIFIESDTEEDFTS